MIREYNQLNDAFRGVDARRSDQRRAAQRGQYRGAEGSAAGSLAGGKDVELLVKVDPAIIGGLIVKLGSRMVDGSLKTKLNAIRTRMKEVG